MQKKHREMIEFQIIQKAIEGDVIAINQVVNYFQPYVTLKCKRKFIDDVGRVYYVVDEYMKRRMEIKLITKILKFEIRI